MNKNKNMSVIGMKQTAGQYSMSYSTTLPWKKTISLEEKKQKTMKPIIHEIFHDCAKMTDDDFWQSIFMNCARGKFPRCFTFKNNVLTHKKGSKVSTLQLENSKTETFISTMKFFQVMAGIMSTRDRKNLQEIEEEKLSESLNKNQKWKDIRLEKYQEVLILEYVNLLTKTYNLSSDDKKELTTVIKKGIMLKYFNNDNILLKDKKIFEIKGLIKNPETGLFDIDSDYIKNIETYSNDLGIETENSDIAGFLNNWKKFLESLNIKRNKKVSTYSSSALTESVMEYSKG